MSHTTKPSQAELREKLTAEQYHVTQEKGTERPFTGKYWNFKENGTYTCVVCGEPLFESDTKFDSGCGWPSFFAPLQDNNIDEHTDRSFFMVRTEVTCSKCGAHLGHVFDDDSSPSGKHYCLNSVCLGFKPTDSKPSKKEA